MEDKYFHFGVTIELPEGIRACLVTLPTHSNIGLKNQNKQGQYHGRQVIFCHLINQKYEKKAIFAKRESITALIVLNEKINENFKMEMDNILAERIKKEKHMFNLNKLLFYINNYICQTRISLARKHFRQNVFSF